MASLAVNLDAMLPLHELIASSPNEYGEEPIGDRTETEIISDRIFAASDQAVLLANADTGIILQANPAASSMLSLPQTALVGAEFLSIFDDAGATELKCGVAEAKLSGSAAANGVRGRNGRSLSVQLSLARSGRQTYIIARLVSQQAAICAPRLNPKYAVLEAIDAAPMGFLMAAADFHVDYANRAFVRMVKARSQADVRDNSILRWLRFDAADLSRLGARLSQRHASDLLTTFLYPNHGQPQKVEVCAVPLPDGLNAQWGFTVRHVLRPN